MKTKTWLSLTVIGALAAVAVTVFSSRALAQTGPQSGPTAVATQATAGGADGETADDQAGETPDTDVEQADAQEPQDAQEAGSGLSEADEAAALASQATLTSEQAQTAALAAHPGATVVKTDLDNENGVIAYSVELSDGVEVKVDALNGTVLGTETADH